MHPGLLVLSSLLASIAKINPIIYVQYWKRRQKQQIRSVHCNQAMTAKENFPPSDFLTSLVLGKAESVREIGDSKAPKGRNLENFLWEENLATSVPTFNV